MKPHPTAVKNARLVGLTVMERVSAMKNVRIFFSKTGRLKIVSHLDMTRFMSRLIAKSKIPVWYTEGFNQHIYMNFALPLSLGLEGLYEVMDFRLIDDNYDLNKCLEQMEAVCPPDIEFFSIAEPVTPMKEIGWAEYELNFSVNSTVIERFYEFLTQESVICEKVGKKGKVKQIDLIPKISGFTANENKITLRLIAGTEDNLNPSLVMSTFFEQTNTEPFFYTVKRTAILDKKLNLFK